MLGDGVAFTVSFRTLAQSGSKNEPNIQVDVRMKSSLLNENQKDFNCVLLESKKGIKLEQSQFKLQLMYLSSHLTNPKPGGCFIKHLVSDFH